MFFARRELRLLLGEPEVDFDFTLLKLGHVLFCSPDRTITLDAGFSPSFISVCGSRYLLSCLKEIVGLLQHRG
ncbi:type VI secretion system baseplate subunit TssK, partial [Pseudomonas syringae group genomosp. 7]|uniref:type VI secretion system baseplate subunit TssK n=1 Tax=Pseudomonas syringae group genomosp. 7 TaxID=251699 RepID=UPI00376FB901